MTATVSACGARTSFYVDACFPQGEIQLLGPIKMQCIGSLRYYYAGLGSGNVVPKVASNGVGKAVLEYDPATRRLSGRASFSGLTATAVHIHEGAVGANGAIAVSLSTGASPLAMDGILTEAQATTLAASGFYLDVHTDANAAREIRGQLTP